MVLRVLEMRGGDSSGGGDGSSSSGSLSINTS